MKKNCIYQFYQLEVTVRLFLTVETYTLIHDFTATRKRFYKKTGILRSEGKFEITLDQRKLKTPKGDLFTVESEPLALAVASEWDAQRDVIVQSKMHLVRFVVLFH